MKDELEEKQVWIAPEVIDLDIEDTTVKISTEAESGGFGKGS